MTFFALFFCMDTFKFKTGQVVVKLVLVKTDNCKISAMVVAVAGDTCFSRNFRRGVETFFFVSPGFDLGVAVKAFPVGNFLSKFMALRTVGHTVEACMDLRQFPRRYLPIATY